MAPIQWSMEEGSQDAGGSHPRRCVTDWDFCVTAKQEANHVLFVATTKPASPFTVGCLSPQWSVWVWIYSLFIPLLCPQEAKFQCCILHLQGSAGAPQRPGWRRQRGSAGCVQWLIQRQFGVLPPTHTHLRGFRSSLWTSRSVRHQYRPSHPCSQVSDHSGTFLKSCRELSGVKVCLDDILVEIVPHSASRSTAWDY